MNDDKNFYESQEIISERVQLAEDIKLPDNILEYSNTKAKFFIKLFTPLENFNNTKSETNSAPNISRKNNNNLKSSSYNSSNYIYLTIPRYILLNFIDIVPKGTEFIITCIGEFKIEHFRIIGIYTLNKEDINTDFDFWEEF